MSNEALTLVSKLELKPSGRKFVLMALADYADESFSCYPSIPQIAKYTSQGEKTVRDHLLSLEEDGYLTRDRMRMDNGMLGRYRFFIQRRISPVADFASGEKQPQPAANFAGHNPHNIYTTTKNITRVRETSKNAKEILAEALGHEISKRVIEHRSAKGTKMSPRAAELLVGEFKKSEAAGLNISDCVDLMISRNWTGYSHKWALNASSDQQRHQITNSRPPKPISAMDKLREMQRANQVGDVRDEAPDQRQIGFLK